VFQALTGPESRRDSRKACRRSGKTLPESQREDGHGSPRWPTRSPWRPMVQAVRDELGLSSLGGCPDRGGWRCAGRQGRGLRCRRFGPRARQRRDRRAQRCMGCQYPEAALPMPAWWRNPGRPAIERR